MAAKTVSVSKDDDVLIQPMDGRLGPSAIETIRRCKRVLFRLGWRHPFFMLPASRVLIRVDPIFVQTMAVDARGMIYVNPTFVGSISDEVLEFALAHEIMHLLMYHFARRGTRIPEKWNRAGDRAINFGLTECKLAVPDWVLMPLKPEHRSLNAEQLYEEEPAQPGDGASGKVVVVIRPGAGCGTLPGDPGQPGGGEGDGAGGETLSDGSLPELSKAGRIWRGLAAAASAQARSAGDTNGDILAKILDPPPSKVKWKQVLQRVCSRAISEHGRDDVSWVRRNRRSFQSDFILPGGITNKATATVVVDTSGSMSDDDLKQCVAETKAIVDLTKVAVYLVVHDAVVQWEGWLKPGVSVNVIASRMIGRGGTVFTPAYDAVGKVRNRFDAMVHLTDGVPFEPWPAKPLNCRSLTIALLGCKAKHALPEGARVVEVEL